MFGVSSPNPEFLPDTVIPLRKKAHIQSRKSLIHESPHNPHYIIWNIMLFITLNVTVIDSDYVGRSSHRFHILRDQHVSKSLRNWLINGNDKPTNSPSSIDEHLLNSLEFAKHYEDKKFSILATWRNAFHLSFLESMYIKTKIMQTAIYVLLTTVQITIVFVCWLKCILNCIFYFIVFYFT